MADVVPVAVGTFIGTRADLAPMAPVLQALAASQVVTPLVLTGVAHTAVSLRGQLERYGVPQNAEVLAVAPPLEDTDREEIVSYGPELSSGMSRTLVERRPKALVVLGDRWELLYVVPPAVLLGTTVVHLHGGEITEGALDDRVRDAITKLADYHCVATESAADRLLQMRVPAERIVLTGAPGLDHFAMSSKGLTDVQFEALVGLPLVRPVTLVTYHPPTAIAGIDLRASAEAVFAETARASGTAVITWPGMDPGRDEIMEAMHLVAQRAHNVAVVDKLGESYGAMMATVDAVVGNSSSGIIEAASFELPALDVGDRQRGRVRGRNVLHADDDLASIRRGLDLVLQPEFRSSLAGIKNPYGDGRAAARVLAVVEKVVTGGVIPSYWDHQAPASVENRGARERT